MPGFFDDIGIPTYSVLLYLWDREDTQDPNARRFVVDLSSILTADIQINKERNRPDDCSFQVEYVQFKNRLKDEGTYAPNVLKPWLSEIKVQRNFKTVFSGFIYSMRLSLGEINKQVLEIKCFDWSKMFEKRFVSKGYGNMSYPQIAQALIIDAQHELNWIENYAFEASDNSSYFSNWDINGNPSPEDNERPARAPVQHWNGGITIPAGRYIQTSTQGANDYKGEELYFSLYHYGAASTLTLTFYNGQYNKKVFSGTAIGSRQISIPAAGTWAQYQTTFTIPAGNITHIRIHSSAALNVTELQLYRKSNVLDDYDLGIQQGDINTTTSSGATYNYRTDRIRHYHHQTVLDALYNLSKLQADANDGDQFEFFIDEDKKLQIYKYHGTPIADPAVALTYPGDIKTLEINRSVENVNNIIIGTADEDLSYKDAEGNETQYRRKWSSVAKDPESVKNLGALMNIQSYSGVDEQLDIDSKTGADLNSYADIQEMPTISVDSNVYNPSNLDIGDAIGLTVLEDDLFTFINGVYRVYSYNLSVTKDSVEKMRFTLITPTLFTLQMMSFVQRFKLNENAIKRLQQR